ncbi:MAG: N-formylglutamate amidohydrolase [Rhodobacteraceae bacterium]|nr:N-formylglutamate amidohydrolase [Paracoccaceae bacterium]
MKTEILEILPARTAADILICVEHAGVHIPEEFNGLGLQPDDLYRHIGWDIGVDGMAHHLHKLMGLPTILGKISRLVIDLNRFVSSTECIPERSDGTEIPGNIDLPIEHKQMRINRYYTPFHRSLNELITHHQPQLLICLHSFTRKLRSRGIFRPWHCGILFDQQVELGSICIAHLGTDQNLIIGENQPYAIDHDSEQPKALHGELKGVPTLLLEIRNDQISTESGQQRWAEIVGNLIESCLMREKRISSRAA